MHEFTAEEKTKINSFLQEMYAAYIRRISLDYDDKYLVYSFQDNLAYIVNAFCDNKVKDEQAQRPDAYVFK